MRSGAPAVLSVFDIEPRFIGGTETYARELSRQLHEHGWQSVLCFATPPPSDVHRFLDLPGTTLDLTGDMEGPSLRVAARLARALRRHRPQIVHFHYTRFLSAFPWMARLLGAERVFFTDHASRPSEGRAGRASWPRRRLTRAINWPLSRVVSVSDYGHRVLRERDLIDPGRCTRVYNGVDLGRVEPRPDRAAAFRRRYAIPAERSIVLQVSWIIPEKGVLDFLLAGATVLTGSSDVQFVVVGEGAFRQEYMRKAGELGLGDHVTWTGLVEDPVEAGVYDAADVTCQPSRWEEIFGWVIAEAMAYCKPLVATRVGAIPELVLDGESGFLVDRGDVAGLARHISLLIEDPARRRAMGTVGRARVERLFDLRRNVAQLIGLYELPELRR